MKRHLHELLRAVLILGAILLCAKTAAGASFTLTWKDNSSNEGGFTIERAPGLDAVAGWQVIANPPVNATSHVDNNLPPSTAYSYRVRAWNTAGVSGWSNTASGTTIGSVPAAPTDAAATPEADYVPPPVTVSATLVLQGATILSAQVEASPGKEP